MCCIYAGFQVVSQSGGAVQHGGPQEEARLSRCRASCSTAVGRDITGLANTEVVETRELRVRHG